MDSLNAHLADFSLSLLRDVAQNHTNVICSPLSITIALAMVFAGSGGNTKNELKSTIFGTETEDEQVHSAFNNILSDSLALPNSEPQQNGFGAVTNRHELLRLEIANSLFPSKRLMTGHSFNPDYLNRLRNSYKMEREMPTLDYSDAENAAKVINDWVKLKTNGKIRNLVSKDSLNSNTAMLLVNAIYFKSPWLTPFMKGFTTKEIFFKNAYDDGTLVPMMKLTSSFPYYADPNRQFMLALLPYSNRNYSFFILLPTETDGIGEVLHNLTGSQLLHIINSAEEVELKVSLPKFKVESKFSLKSTLKRLGISNLFNNANLTGISTAPLNVDEVAHMAMIEVDEDGTEAAAATAVQIVFRSAVRVSTPFEFNINHQCLMGIWEKRRNQIIFMGILADPHV